jgi:hypothetical protein
LAEAITSSERVALYADIDIDMLLLPFALSTGVPVKKIDECVFASVGVYHGIGDG